MFAIWSGFRPFSHRCYSFASMCANSFSFTFHLLLQNGGECLRWYVSKATPELMAFNDGKANGIQYIIQVSEALWIRMYNFLETLELIIGLPADSHYSIQDSHCFSLFFLFARS